MLKKIIKKVDLGSVLSNDKLLRDIDTTLFDLGKIENKTDVISNKKSGVY